MMILLITSVFASTVIGSIAATNLQGAQTVLQHDYTVGQAVKTTSGIIVGHPAPNLTDVSEYLGIPYARAPVGELRFAPPEAFVGLEVINATAYSPDCPCNPYSLPTEGLASEASYRLLAQRAQVGNVFSEDCLTLNIWTKPQSGEISKAVLLYIHGGGFSTGTPNDPALNGQYFAADQDVVIVSINYRLNIFGFPGLPGMAQNLGFLDQRKAVEWVYTNIAGFGGDPERITLFGQSAGAASVDIYSFAWTQDPLVHGFIEQSGTADSFLLPAPSNNTEAWYKASMRLGCGGPSEGIQATVACMRTKSFEDIVNASASTGAGEELGTFSPTVDGMIVFSDYSQRARSGKFVRKPYLIGNNDYEAGLFKLTVADAGVKLSDKIWAIADLAAFSCPAQSATSSRTKYVPTYRYRYYGDFPNTRLSINPSSGAWHGAELPVVWNTAADASLVSDTKDESRIAVALQGAWAAFAKNPESALLKAPYNWPRYSDAANTLIRLAYNNESEASFTSPITYDIPCHTMRQIQAKLPGPVLNLLTAPESVLEPLNQYANLTAMGGGGFH